MGCGVGQGGKGGGLAEADATEGFPCPTAKVGGGAYLRMDKPQPEDGQRLREVVRHRRGLRLRGDDETDGEEVDPRIGVSKLPLEGVL